MNKPISRRNFLKFAGGAAVRLQAPGWRRGHPQGSAAGGRCPSPDGLPAARPVLCRHGRLDQPARESGNIFGLFGRGETHPDNLAPAPFTTYIFGFRNVTGLDPTRSSDEPEEQGAAHRAVLLGRSVQSGCTQGFPDAAHQPGAGACAPTCSTRTRSTGTASAMSSRSSTASRPARSRCRPGGFSPTSTGRAIPARTCTTATSRTSSTSTWA